MLTRGYPALAAVSLYLALGIGLTAAWWFLGGRSAEHTGLVRHLYPGTSFSGTPRLTAVTTDLTLDFIDDAPALPRRFFSVRWQGYWYVPETRTFTLYGSGDDRLDVWLDDEHVISRAPPADMHTVGREVTLAAGAHRLRVDYAQQGGAYAMGLSWQPRGARRRALAPHRLFRDTPGPEEVQLARHVRLLGWGVLLVWTLPLLVVTPLLATRHADRCRRAVSALSFGRYGPQALRAGLLLALGAVVVRAVFARLPGLNPGSFWYDDLVYAAIMRTEDLWSMLKAPLHVGPGLLAIWRGLYTVFPDPEWSLQLLPFASGIAAIPVMALAVRAVTGEDGLAVLAAGVTALNQMLARYTVFVHQYAIEFLVTALFLLAAARLSPNLTAADPRRFGRVAVCGGLATVFSVTSVFISFPVVNLGAACAARDWWRDRRRAARMLGIAAAYNVTVLVAYLLLRNRSNPSARALFSDGFMPLDSAIAALGFLAENGRYLLETSLPSWGTGWYLNPGTVSWPLPFLFLGLAWLLAQPSTRFLGLVVLCFYAERIVASVLWIYPLGMGRTDVFAFPVGICLFAAGIQAATAALPRPARFRLAAAAAVVAFALARPVDAWYFDTDDVPLVDDCSTDRTLAVLRKLASVEPRLRVVARERNGGVGAAMRSGYRAALDGDADLIVKMDGDGQMDSAELPRLLQPLVEGRADYAKGNRFRHVRDLGRMPRVRLFGNVLLTFMTKLVSGYWRVFDAQNGYTAITRDALDALPLDRLDSSYAFENSMLSLLNIESRPVADVAMPAVYQDERSSMSVTRVLFSFPPRLVGMLARRLFLKYLVYDVSPIAIYAIFGSSLLGFATSFGGYHWWQSIRTGIPAATGTTVVALLTFLMGYMLLLQAVNLDITQSPHLREPREELDLDAVPGRFSVRGGVSGARAG